MSTESKAVVDMISDKERISKSRIHPFQLLLAHTTYAEGKGYRGSGSWTAVPQIVDALDVAYYESFKNVESTGLNYYLGIDVSGSMAWEYVANSPVSAAQGAAAMAMVSFKTEPWAYAAGFANEMRDLGISAKDKLATVIQKTSDHNFGGTDCALPMLDAMNKGLDVDVFVVYTDSETWAGGIHPTEALDRYNNKMGKQAKMIVCGMTSTGFTIADPQRNDMLDVVGFDASAPAVISNFSKGEI